MSKQFRDFNVLTSNVAEHLKSRLNFSPPAVEEYRKIWRRISFFMDSRGYKHYSPDVEKELLKYHFNERPKSELKKT